MGASFKERIRLVQGSVTSIQVLPVKIEKTSLNVIELKEVNDNIVASKVVPRRKRPYSQRCFYVH